MGVFVDKLDSLHAITKNAVKQKRKVCLPSFDFFFCFVISLLQRYDNGIPKQLCRSAS